VDPRLKNAIDDKSLVLVLGTGVSAAATDGAPAATWRGLLESGVELVKATTGDPQWADAMQPLIKTGFGMNEPSMIVAAASAVKDKVLELGANAAGKWLSEQIGQLTVANSALVDELRALPFPLLTTNYDTLVEGDGRRARSWRDHVAIRDILAGTSRDIGHLHGVWNEPESVILSPADYQMLRSSDAAVELEQAASSLKTLVYIGYGAGLADPNFSKLVEWHAQRFGSARPHFRLCLNSEVDALRASHANDHIVPVSYGSNHGDLPAFLREHFAPTASVALTPAGIARDVVSEAQITFGKQLMTEVIVAESRDLEAHDLNEALLPPILLTVPHAEYVRAKRAGRKTPEQERLDPHEEIKRGGVTIIVAEENTGLTTAIKWLAIKTALLVGSAAPLYVPFTECRKGTQKPLLDAIRMEARRAGIGPAHADVLPPYVLALDDLTPYTDPISSRVITELRDGDAVAVYIGCRFGEEDDVVGRLTGLGVAPTIRYLGRLASDDIAELAKLASPGRHQALARRVEKAIHADNLPRTPFTVSLLLAVLMKSGALRQGSSQTAILNDYVGLLLGRGNPHEDARLSMDQGSREAVLGVLAQAFVAADKGGLLESQVLATFEEAFSRFGWSESSLELLNYFLQKRLLRREAGNIMFARSSFLHLFAAKRAVIESTFRDALLHRPLYYSSALTDYAALNRHDADLLRKAVKLLEDEVWESGGSGVYTEMLLTEVEGEEQHEENADQPDAGGRADAQSTSALDFELLDDTDQPPFPTADERNVPRGLLLMRTLDLVSSVLRDSDQIEDLDLKAASLATVLHHWGVAMNELWEDGSFKRAIHSLADAVFTSEHGEELSEAAQEEFLKAMIAAITLSGIATTLASRKLIGILDRAQAAHRLKDSEQSTVAAAFFVFVLHQRGWPEHVRELLGEHRNIWVLRAFFSQVLENTYLRGHVETEDEKGLLDLWASIEGRSRRFNDETQRASYQSRLTQRLQRARLQRQMKHQRSIEQAADGAT
jgi:hypothetical protein